MQTLAIRLLLLLITLAANHHVNAASVALTSETFNQIASKGTWLIEHFSPYCPHCIDFAPLWNQLAEEHSGLENKDFYFGTVDCTAQGDLCAEHNVRGYPTLQLYVHGRLVETYKGTRKWETLTAYINENADKYVEQSIHSSVSVDLDEANLNRIKMGSESWFVKFYTPWCPHCQKLAPTWSMLAKELASSNVGVAEVNCQEHSRLCSENGIEGYPTLQLYSKQNMHSYHGSRTLADLANFARRYGGPSIIGIQDNDDLETKLLEQPTAVVYLTDATIDNIPDVIEQVAAEYVTQDIPFLAVQGKEASSRFGLQPKELPAIVISKEGGQQYDVFHYKRDLQYPDWNKNAIMDWIDSFKYPLVSRVGPHNAEDLLRGKNFVVLGVIRKNDDTHQKKLHDLALSIRSNKELNVLFAWLDADTWSGVAKDDYGITDNRVPALVVIDGKTKQFFDLDNEGKPLSFDHADSLLSSLSAIDAGQRSGTPVAQWRRYLGLGNPTFSATQWLLTGVGIGLLAAVWYRKGRSKDKTTVLPLRQSVSSKHRD